MRFGLFFRAMKKKGFEQAKKDSAVRSSTDVAVPPSPADVGQIEKKILVRELLDTLSPRDREIVMRRVSGDTFPEIDNEMKLKPRTAETRFRASKAILRKLLDQDLGRETAWPLNPLMMTTPLKRYYSLGSLIPTAWLPICGHRGPRAKEDRERRSSVGTRWNC